jgi:hypothetical protein
MPLSIIKELEETSSKNDKKVIFERELNNELFKRVLVYGYDGDKTYYLSKIPEFESSGEVTKTLSDLFDALDKLVSREVTGQDAKALISDLLSLMSEDDVEIARRIVSKKMDIGASVSTLNKIFGKSFLRENPYLGARSFDSKRLLKYFEDNDYLISELKMDGQYQSSIISNDISDFQFKSRNGEDSYLAEHLVSELMQVKNKISNEDLVFMGETTIPGIDRSTANGIINAVSGILIKRRDGEDDTKNVKDFNKKHSSHGTVEEILSRIVYTVWDVVNISEYNDYRSDVFRIDRLNSLENAFIELKEDGVDLNSFPVKFIEYKLVNTAEEAMSHFQIMLEREEEGTILKEPTAIWEHKHKPTYQMKMKLQMGCELRIVGFNEGKSNTKYSGTLGSLQLESEDNVLKTDAGGLSDELRYEIWNNQDEYLNKIVEVISYGISRNRDGGTSMLYANFVEFRKDKTEADTFDIIKQIEDAAKSLKTFVRE